MKLTGTLTMSLVINQYEAGSTAQRKCDVTFTAIEANMTLPAEQALDLIIGWLNSCGGIVVQSLPPGGSHD